ncbi:ornithine cyclodeaminase family protein [Virgibacillus kekensis]|uniref:Ornithine cyclodeaminase family protein n=1 Tax=Virgibacillus kekensis TaxID=202261 RepID=A0ABV9DHT9_9BACI
MDILSAQDINKLITMEEVIRAIENYYLNEEANDETSPDRMHVDDDDNTALLMPAFYGDYYSVKLVGVAPHNTEAGKPTIHGTMLLHDRKTMEPIMVCDAMPITALRTGALGGLGMKYISSPDASSIGIIGTGTQGWSHLQSACAVRPIKTVYVYNRSQKKMADFIARAEKEFPELTVKESKVEDLVQYSDIIITTTTSPRPVLPDVDPSVWKGKQVIAVGSFKPNMQELPDSLFKQVDAFYVDGYSAFNESGDMIRAGKFGANENDAMSLEEIISKQHTPENIAEKTLVFKSVGMSIFDLVATKAIYEKIKQQKGD